mmetsp:Transcript_3268/g.9484  ORF Transcript_3268/g.9484 Transcript_3268/m.9484 type:complete len:361 (+) Transcript_3268:60-1142(+)
MRFRARFSVFCASRRGTNLYPSGTSKSSDGRAPCFIKVKDSKCTMARTAKFTGTEARTGNTCAAGRPAPPPPPEDCCATFAAFWKFSEERTSWSRRIVSCSTDSASRIGRNCCKGMGKSVANQTLAETALEVLPTLSFFGSLAAVRPCFASPSEGFEPPPCQRASWDGPRCRTLACEGVLSRQRLRCGVSHTCSSWLGRAFGHPSNTSDVVDIASMSKKGSPALPPKHSVLSDHALRPVGSRISSGSAMSAENSALNSGQHAFAGSGRPKCCWKVSLWLRCPFFFTATPKVPLTSKRRAFHPLMSTGPARLPSQVVASETSNSSTFMSHCITSAATISSTTTETSSESKPSVMSTAVCFE